MSAKSKKEIWRTIPGYPSYYRVSNFGQVKAVKRQTTGISKYGVTFTREYPEIILGQHMQDGIPKVAILLECGQRSVSVGLLVLQAFKGPQPKGTRICWLNDDMSDSRPSNLYYGHRKQKNNRERKSKFTLEQLRAIRATKGVKEIKDLAARLGTSWRWLYNIRAGKVWADRI